MLHIHIRSKHRAGHGLCVCVCVWVAGWVGRVGEQKETLVSLKCSESSAIIFRGCPYRLSLLESLVY